jgi:hypothetical protein
LEDFLKNIKEEKYSNNDLINKLLWLKNILLYSDLKKLEEKVNNKLYDIYSRLWQELDVEFNDTLAVVLAHLYHDGIKSSVHMKVVEQLLHRVLLYVIPASGSSMSSGEINPFSDVSSSRSDRAYLKEALHSLCMLIRYQSSRETVTEMLGARPLILLRWLSHRDEDIQDYTRKILLEW